MDDSGLSRRKQPRTILCAVLALALALFPHHAQAWVMSWASLNWTAGNTVQSFTNVGGSGVTVTIELKRNDKALELCAPSEMKIQQVKDILMQKFGKKEISYKSLSLKKSEKAANGGVKESYGVVCGIDKEMAKSIVKDIKDSGVKVQASIQDEKVRVTGKSKDDLQSVIALLRGKDYPIPLQFTNYR